MKTTTFRERYQGPDGPHLSLLTYYTRHGKLRDLKFEKSIHPFRPRGVSNTSAPHREVRGVNPFGRSQSKFRGTRTSFKTA
jgi:hypothetical protein